MPWTNYLAYSTLITVNTMYVVLNTQHKHPITFSVILLTMVFVFTGLIGLGEWYRMRQDREPPKNDE